MAARTKSKEKKAKPKNKPHPQFKLGRECIGFLLKKDFPIAYARELKIFYSLFESYPNENFWKSLDIGFHLNSLAFFKTDKGVDILERHWGVFNFEIPQKETVELDNFKHGEDKVFQKKPRSFQEFYSTHS